MRYQSNSNQRVLNRVLHSGPALQTRVYGLFLEMRELLEHHGPLWYTEALHKKAEAIMRAHGARAKSKSQKEKPRRRQKLIRRSGFVPSQPSRQLHLTNAR